MMAILHVVFWYHTFPSPRVFGSFLPVDQVKALEKVCTDLVTGAKAKDLILTQSPQWRPWMPCMWLQTTF